MFKIILSDLHIGAGGQGNPLEDFHHDATLAQLLGDLAHESDYSGQEVELILNGDAFEFWQVPALDTHEDFVPTRRYPDRYYAGTTASESERRMAMIVAGHRQLFQALGAFLQETEPRRSLTIIKGNHDVQLHWPSVQNVLRDALDARGSRQRCLSFVPLALQRDRLYLEHGSQHAEALNRHPSFDDPVNPRDPSRLLETPGARIFIRAINRLERDLVWISSVKPMTAVGWFLLRYRPLMALRLAWLFFPALPTLLRVHHPLARSNRQLAQDVAAGTGEGTATSASGLGTPPNETPPSLASLETLLSQETLSRDPILARGLLEEHALHAQLMSAADRVAQETGARIVLFGHTHVPALEVLKGGAIYLNTGSWNWEINLDGKPAQAWRRLICDNDLGSGEAFLSYVRVDYIDDEPVASLREYMPNVTPVLDTA